MNKTLDTARPIDLTPSEAETLGKLLDIIHEHINDYERPRVLSGALAR